MLQCTCCHDKIAACAIFCSHACGSCHYHRDCLLANFGLACDGVRTNHPSCACGQEIPLSAAEDTFGPNFLSADIKAAYIVKFSVPTDVDVVRCGHCAAQIPASQVVRRFDDGYQFLGCSSCGKLSCFRCRGAVEEGDTHPECPRRCLCGVELVEDPGWTYDRMLECECGLAVCDWCAKVGWACGCKGEDDATSVESGDEEGEEEGDQVQSVELRSGIWYEDGRRVD